VSAQAGQAVNQLVDLRKSVGVQPQHLLVLEMEFVHASQLDLLVKLGARVLDEGEKRVPLDPPLYAVPLKFDTADRRGKFEALGDLSDHGIVRVRRDRGSRGEPHELRVTACFENLDPAKTFWQDESLSGRYHFKVGKSPPKREATETRHSWLVEFPDLNAVEKLQGWAGAQGAGTGPSVLTETEWGNLLDAVDLVRALTPADRTGPRLATEGVPAKAEFAIDVDLWHPAGAALVAAEISTFRDLVARHKGRVTDGPVPVAGTYFLARVKGGPETLDAILRYDRVAMADLPPKLPATPSTIFDPVPLPDPALPYPGDDAPLACVVDSGVLAGHPLLSGWVLDERDFDSGDGTAVDQAGHGTHVAGIVVYGDIHRCVHSGRWDPKVRVLSAKVLRNNGGCAEFAEDNDERIETQLRRAITSFRREYGCRVFNLSLGHGTRRYLAGRQLPWALVLDDLARAEDVVLVVSAGNVSQPDVPDAATEPELRAKALEQLLGDDHALIDPASAMLALTVGSIARGDTPFRAFTNPDRRPALVDAPPLGPSPFTRAGRLAGTGAGPAKAVKPDLVAFGGNYYLSSGGRWLDNDVLLGEPSLNLDYTTSNRLLRAATGTSVAAPFVTHVCALVEHGLRQLPRWGDRAPSANLIRALTVHSAEVPRESAEWVGAEKCHLGRRLRLLGYGLPDAGRALRSTDGRVVLVAEDELEDGHYHIYELDIPARFARLNSRRWIRVTLAYDPPVRGTRKEYLIRKLYFRLVRAKTVEQIEHAAREGRDCDQPGLAPGIDWVRDSTVQSATFECKKPWPFNGGEDSYVTWHVVVRSEPRLDDEPLGPQRYALVVSLQHGDPGLKLNNLVRARVESRTRVHWPSA
jgi:hypothetical protein